MRSFNHSGKFYEKEAQGTTDAQRIMHYPSFSRQMRLSGGRKVLNGMKRMGKS